MKSKFYILLTMLLACTMQVKAEETTEVITKEVGTNDSGSTKVALCPYDRNSGSQTLYLSSEIGQAGIISEISYYVRTYASSSFTGQVKIYMVETDKTTLTASDHITSRDKMTLVYDSGSGNYTGPTSTGWETFTLTNPFCYGGKNLIVATEVTKTKFNINLYYASTSLEDRRIIRSNDTQGKNGNAFDSEIVAGDGTTTDFSAQNVPYTQFTFKATGTKFGTGTTVGNSYFGYSPYVQNSATQHLYLNTEVGKSGIINNLAFQVYSSATTELNHSVKIYMAEVAQTSLTAPLSTSNMTLVFDGTVKLGGKQKGDWIGVDLTSPFLYTGIGSLVVAISNTESTANTGHRFMTTSATSRSVYTTSSSIPNNATTTSSYLPNALFSFAIHGNCSSYSEDGFGICPNCETELKYVFEEPTDVSRNYEYAITNVGELMWVASRVNKGLADKFDYFYISNYFDLTGYNWIPIGTDSNPLVSRIYGYDYDSEAGNTISGIPSTSSLVGTLSGGTLGSLRLTSGAVANKGLSGTIGQCLTLGSALLRSGSATIEKSYYLSTSSSSAEIGPRSSEQMKSGQVTYELNSYQPQYGYKTTWYQTLGTDDYPMVINSRKRVYRYTQCSGTSFGYSNTASLSGTVQSHTYTNSICSECNAQPTTFSQDIELSRVDEYKRTVQAQVASDFKLTHQRTLIPSYVGKWLPLYVPFSFAVDANTYDLAEIQGFGLIEDTNRDGDVNTQDEKELIVNYLKDGDVTTPNKPYLFRMKSNTSVTFTSTDGKLYPNTINEQTFSTMKDQIVITPTYTKTTTSGVQKQLVGGALMNRNGGDLYPFTWKATPSYKNGNKWDQLIIKIFAHRFGLTELVDNDNLSSDFVPYTQALEEVVDNLWYERTFVERQAHNWQSMYLPFDVTVEDSGDDVYPKYATFESITTEGGVDYINIKKCVKGDVIKANTPALICVDAAKTLTYDYPLVTLKPASSATSTVFNSSLATYTLVGSYAPYQSGSEWYAISKKDGDFHPMTATAKLPPYRFYMTIVKKSSGAGELRVVIRDIDEVATAIDSVFGEEDTDAIYTLDGRKVQEESLQPGIYVKNGKKISIKK